MALSVIYTILYDIYIFQQCLNSGLIDDDGDDDDGGDGGDDTFYIRYFI